MNESYDFRAVLIEQAERKQQEWDIALAQRREADLALERLRRYVQPLNALLLAEGLKPLNLDVPEDKGGGFAQPGNRAAEMPPRRADYVGMSLPDAINRLLGPRPMHADEIADNIFEIRSNQDRKMAKRTLVSTLATGARKGKWGRGPSPNTYVRGETERARPDANQVALAPA